MGQQNRPLPWAGPGFATAFDKTGSAEKSIDAAGLAWEVGLVPVFIKARDSDVLGKKVEGHRAVVRSDNGLPLGVVGMQYTAIQNREMLRFVDFFRDIADIETEPVGIGEFEKGRRVFAVLKLKLEEAIAERWAKVALIDVYLIMTNAHDGTAAFRVGFLPIVRDGTIQLRLQLGPDNPGIWSIRHLSHVKKHVREILVATKGYLKRFESVMIELAKSELSDEAFTSFLEQLIVIPAKAGKRTVNNRLRYRAGIREAYEGLTEESPAGTRWDALNAVAAWEQWSKPRRVASGKDQMDSLFARLIMARGNEYANRALRLLMSEV